MPSLNENLERAFTEQSRANRKYLAFVRKAEHEGHMQAAKLFRAAAEAAAIHAQNCLRALDAIKGTRENLQTSVEKSRKSAKIYPPMIEDAKAQNDSWATKSFCYAFEAENVYANLFERAIEDSRADDEIDYFICKVCGFTVEGEPPEMPRLRLTEGEF